MMLEKNNAGIGLMGMLCSGLQAEVAYQSCVTASDDAAEKLTSQVIVPDNVSDVND